MSKTGENACIMPFILPRNFLLCGPTGCGKTSLMCQMIEQSSSLFDPPPDRFIVCYQIWQDSYSRLERSLGERIQFQTSIPTKHDLIEHWETTGDHTLLCIDDQMASLDDGASGKALTEIVTVLSHHCQCSTMILSQNLYHNSKSTRTIALNTHYTILFRNDRGAAQVRKLGWQIMPNNPAYLVESYNTATSRPFGYLLIDFSPNLDRKWRLRTDVLPGQDLKLFLPKNGSHEV